MKTINNYREVTPLEVWLITTLMITVVILLAVAMFI